MFNYTHFGNYNPLYSFLNEVHARENELKRLQNELDNILYLSASPGGEIHSTEIADTTSNFAAEIEKIKDEMKRITHFQEVYIKSLAELTEDEMSIITLFHFAKGNKGKLVSEFCEREGYSRSELYRMKNIAEDRLAYLIGEKL